MKRSSLFCLIFTALLACVAAWTKEDHEIFRLRDELELNEGKDVNFYNFVGVSSSASQADINKAYRKKSARIHPDKAERNFVAQRLAQSSKGKAQVNKRPSQREIKKAVKDAQDRYQRLTVIKGILTGEGRVRYDHFLKNGFPQWRSTGYYYERFRPGLFTTLLGLWIFATGGVHYGVMILTYRQRKTFVDKIIKKARKDAFGNESGTAAIPGIDSIGETVTATAPAPAPAAEQEEGMPEPRNRKERRMMEKMQAKENKGGKEKSSKSASKRKPTKPAAVEPGSPPVLKKRVRAANGKELLVANDGSVYLEEEDEDGNVEEELLDPEAIEKPSFTQTALIQAPFWVVNFVKAKISGETDAE